MRALFIGCIRRGFKTRDFEPTIQTLILTIIYIFSINLLFFLLLYGCKSCYEPLPLRICLSIKDCYTTKSTCIPMLCVTTCVRHDSADQEKCYLVCLMCWMIITLRRCCVIGCLPLAKLGRSDYEGECDI